MSDGFGFDKKARNEAAREARELEEEPPPLNPEFPYHSRPFDYAFFGIEDEVQGLEDE